MNCYEMRITMRKLYTPSIEQKENAKHGESFFPIQRYITMLADDYPVVTTHWHEEAELTLITQGNCQYQIDLINYEVNEGDILFVPPLLLHSISLSQSRQLISETYVFHLNYIGANATDVCSTRYLTPIMNQELAMPCHISHEHPAYASLRILFDKIADLYTNTPAGYELALKSLFIQVIFELIPYSSKVQLSDSKMSPGNGTPSDKLKNVLDYIEINYAGSISIPELAKLCYFSEYHFMRFFKKHMNMTCVEYINNLRLQKAVELFEQGNTSILDVSLSVGFHNLSYFHRAFKKRYNMTPHTFIKRLN